MSGCKPVKENDRQTGRKTAKLNKYGALSDSKQSRLYMHLQLESENNNSK